MTRKEPEIGDELERRVFETIISFPARIDEMETRSEEACRLLARRIADLVRQQERTKDAEPAGGGELR
jgi:hypothetical protein